MYGAVQKPGMVAFADSMTLRDAVMLAGGITDDAFLGEAELSRVRPDGVGRSDSIAVALKVPLDSSYVFDPTGYIRRPVGTATSPTVRLHPYDNVFIRQQPGWEGPRTVVLTGEVRFPGRYALTRRDERLADLIARAGGVTPQAYAGGIRFYRSESAIQQSRDHSPKSGGSPGAQADSAAVQAGMRARVPVDLERVLRDQRFKDNLILSAGDSIHLPGFVPVVRVEGAVNAPTTVAYVSGAGLGYYIGAAGGYARLADRGGTFIQQPNGLIQKKAQPGPGAVVVVPTRESPAPSQFSLPAVMGLIGQLVTAATTVAVVLITRP